MRTTLLILLAACKGEPEPDTSTPPLPDLTSALDAGEVRAGVIHKADALFGGVSAEGQIGDIKMYNHLVRFVVQSVRPGSYYVSEGGGVIDADLARAPDAPGHDIVDEWAPMIGFGRILEPTSVTVVHDGSDGEPAVVRVEGVEAPLALIGGAIESPGFLGPIGVKIVTEYELPADSRLLTVRTTVTAERDVTLAVGDVLFGAPEVAWGWHDRGGFDGDDGDPRRVMGYVGKRQDIAVAVLPPAGEHLTSGTASVLSELAELVIGYGGTVTLATGESHTATRYYGVGPDIATLTSEVLGGSGTPLTGTVTAPDGPVAGASVAILLDDEPYTLAYTGADGTFSTTVPTGTAATAIAVGRGDGLFLDLPAGATPWGAYTALPALDATRRALTEGSDGPPVARGRGVGTAEAPLTLGQPAEIRLTIADDQPFHAWLEPVAADPPADRRYVPGRPASRAAAGFSTDGTLTMIAEPGTYRLVAHRGVRYEVHTAEVTLTAGAPLSHAVELTKAYTHDGWLLGDPHSHAAPSGDASISMEDRLIVTAAVGVQVHFGTDHDHMVDYRPLRDLLGLPIATIVADEVSPPLRGHFNIYPVTPTPGAANGGAWSWWEEIPTSTEAMVDTLRSRHGTGFILQANHPTSSGLGSSAGWEPGSINTPGRWTERFEAAEVLNSGSYTDDLAFFLDQIVRGHRLIPTGVSDSHHHFGGSPGLSATFLGVGTDNPLALTDEALTTAMRAGRVIVTRGPFLEVSTAPGADLAPGATLTVTAHAPSWIQVDRLLLLRDGVEVARTEGTTATFTLSPDADAVYVVTAEGDTPMAPVTGHTPWALAGPYWVDVGGDGWTAPQPPYEL